MAYTERFDEALTFASKLHRTQTRKGKDVPYITHLLAVASLVGTNGGDEDQVIAALLHDAIEDCVADVPDVAHRIEERFGSRVLHIVESCSDTLEPKKDDQDEEDWKVRKQTYLIHLRELPDDSPVLLVSLADKVHNARSIVADLHKVGDELWERFNAGRTDSLWYYSSLAEIFAEKHPGYLATGLQSLVESMKESVADPKPAPEAPTPA